MNILVITEKDAANASMSRIANAFFRRGHKVRVYAPYFEDALLRDFDSKIERFPFDRISDEAYEWCDVIFAASIAAAFLRSEKLLRLRKPIFTHNYLINGQVAWGGDCCFVSSIETSTTDYDDVIPYSRIAIGEPKYDSVEATRESENRFLFIDSGHYPFGDKGKDQLAKTLLDICYRFPDYKLVIKPRFLPGDKVITHRNLRTLYNVLIEQTNGRLPDNLVYLEQHYDLMTLIEQSKTIICLYTTAFVGASVAEKGLIVLEGLDSDDTYDVRLKSFYRIRKNMEYTDALVQYKDAYKYLPEGIKTKKENGKFLFENKNDVAEKICEVSEYLFENFYSKKSFPKIQSVRYSNFMGEIKEDKRIGWDDIVERRIKNYIIQRMLIHIDFNISAKINTKFIVDFVNRLDIAYIDFDGIMALIPRIRSKCISQNKDVLLKDDIDSGILLNAYYILKEYEKILSFKKKDIGAYYLFSGFVLIEREEVEAALEHLLKYFEISKDRDYIKEISDMSNNRFRAFREIIQIFELKNERNKVKYYLDEMISCYENIYFQKISDKAANSNQYKVQSFIKKRMGYFE